MQFLIAWNGKKHNIVLLNKEIQNIVIKCKTFILNIKYFK